MDSLSYELEKKPLYKETTDHLTDFAAGTNAIEQASERLRSDEYEESRLITENASLQAQLDMFEKSGNVYAKLDSAEAKRSINRNRMTILFNDKHFMKSDSTEMTDIKNKLSLLDRALYSPQGMQNLNGVIDAYDEAIGAMNYYIEHKNPWFPEGIRRLRRVRELCQVLKDERDLLSKNAEAFKTDESQKDVVFCVNDFLEGAYLRPALTTQAQSFALKDAVMFSKFKDENGKLDSDMQQIRNAYRRMTEALREEIPKCPDENDDAAEKRYRKKRREVSDIIGDLAGTCDDYLKKYDKAKLSGKELEKYEQIEALQTRMRWCEDEINGVSVAMARGKMAGDSFMDCMEVIEEGLYQGMILEEKLKGVLDDIHKKNCDINTFLTLINGAFEMAEQRNIGSKYDALKTYGSANAIETMSDDDVKDIIVVRLESTAELKDEYDRMVKYPVPKEFLKNETDDPNDEKLRIQYTRLMLTAHPAYFRLKATDCFLNMPNVQFSDKFLLLLQNSRDQYLGSKDEVFKKKQLDGDKLGGKLSSADKGAKDLNQEAVRRFNKTVQEYNISRARKNLQSIGVNGGFLDYHSEKVQQVEAAFETERKRHNDYISQQSK